MRTPNVSKREPCRYCGFSGWCVLSDESAAPCPFCEKGFDVEFPSSGKGPWGEDGFWRGRKPEERGVQGLYDLQGNRLPLPERVRLAQEARNVIRAIDPPKPSRPTLDTLLPDAAGSEAEGATQGESEQVA